MAQKLSPPVKKSSAKAKAKGPRKVRASGRAKPRPGNGGQRLPTARRRLRENRQSEP